MRAPLHTAAHCNTHSTALHPGGCLATVRAPLHTETHCNTQNCSAAHYATLHTTTHTALRRPSTPYECTTAHSTTHCNTLSVLFLIVMNVPPQLHHRADLLCLLLGADDAAAPPAGQEDSLRSGQVGAFQECVCSALFLPHPDRPAGSGRRSAV